MHLKKVESLLNLQNIDLCPWDIFFKYYVDYQSLLILESPTAQGRS